MFASPEISIVIKQIEFSLISTKYLKLSLYDA